MRPLVDPWAPGICLALPFSTHHKWTGWHAQLFQGIWQSKLRPTCFQGEHLSDSHFLAQELIFFSFLSDHFQQYETPILSTLTQHRIKYLIYILGSHVFPDSKNGHNFHSVLTFFLVKSTLIILEIILRVTFIIFIYVFMSVPCMGMCMWIHFLHILVKRKSQWLKRKSAIQPQKAPSVQLLA